MLTTLELEATQPLEDNVNALFHGLHLSLPIETVRRAVTKTSSRINFHELGEAELFDDGVLAVMLEHDGDV